MLKATKKPEVKVTVNIQPGPMTPHMRACWKKWWAARIAEVKQSEAAK